MQKIAVDGKSRMKTDCTFGFFFPSMLNRRNVLSNPAVNINCGVTWLNRTDWMVDFETLRLFASANRSIFKISDGMTVLLLGILVSIKAFEVCKGFDTPVAPSSSSSTETEFVPGRRLLEAGSFAQDKLLFFAAACCSLRRFVY